MSYNLDSLYILDNKNFGGLKEMITSMEGLNVDIVRGSGQKNHILSPLDIRLSFYISAMFDCDYSMVQKYNAFNKLTKDKYLPRIKNSNKKF